VTKFLILIVQRLGLIEDNLGRSEGATLHIASPCMVFRTEAADSALKPNCPLTGGIWGELTGVKRLDGTAGWGRRERI